VLSSVDIRPLVPEGSCIVTRSPCVVDCFTPCTAYVFSEGECMQIFHALSQWVARYILVILTGTSAGRGGGGCWHSVNVHIGFHVFALLGKSVSSLADSRFRGNRF
jgi:hypothetical protein